MKVTFVLPGTGRRPSGGFRIVYEHANRLAERGHSVRLVHAASFRSRRSTLRDRRLLGRFVKDLFVGRTERQKWFALRDDIEIVHPLALTRSAAGEADAVIATSWQTAYFVRDLPPQAGVKFYLVQSYEDWDGPPDKVRLTWKMPLHKIVIADWLSAKADELDERSDFVKNAIDSNFFRISKEILERTPNSVLFQSLERDLKGSAEAVAAINLVRKSGVDLSVAAFGHVDPGQFGLQQPYSFVRNPTQSRLREMYNEAAIYISPSHIEGWGLTVAEAAACGAALLISDIGGHRELGRHEANAIMFKVKDVSDIQDGLTRLVNDPELRVRLARQAAMDVLRFDWPSASVQLEAVLKSHVERQNDHCGDRLNNLPETVGAA